MQVEKISLEKTNLFSQALIDFINNKEVLKPFYGRRPEIEAFQQQIDEKQSSFPESHRTVLFEVLKEQYADLEDESPTHQNIELLKQGNTFTLTTGHQLNIFTGPLYFHFKIVTVINAAKALSAKYPDYNFVPVYWMASEDHDIDEIRSVNVQSQKYTWQTEQQGPVGRFETNGLKVLCEQIPGYTEIFDQAYSSSKSLAEAVRKYVHELYKEQGLVVVDADHKRLKDELKEVINDDLVNHKANSLVNETTTQLEELGYSSQIYPREINFFYVEDGLRERIVQDGDRYLVNNTEISFDEAGILAEVENNPEKFSPNVILRPLYQEIILPNLSYSGGPAELIYWLQLKGVFDHYHFPFPIMLPRNFGVVIDHTVKRKMGKVDLESEMLFTQTHELINETIERYSHHNLKMDQEQSELEHLFSQVRERAVALDTTLERTVLGEAKKAEKSLEKIYKKFLRAEKRNLSDRVQQVEDIRAKLFPNNKPQERTCNFLDFFTPERSFMDAMIASFDPFDLRYHLLYLDEQHS